MYLFTTTVLFLLGSVIVPQCYCCFFRQIYLTYNQEPLSPDQNDLSSADLHKKYIPLSLSVIGSKPSYIVDTRFLSVGLGSSMIRASEKWKHFDFSSVKLKNLANGLAPAVLRVGGTDADFLIFDDDQMLSQAKRAEGSPKDAQYNNKGQRTNFTMPATDWDDINKFASDAGWDVLFDLNMLLRNGTEWDSTNAEELFKYTNEKGYRIAGWEMGNEPNHINNHANITVNATQLGKDYVTLRRLLDRYGFQDSFLVGPDVTKPKIKESRFGESSTQFLSSFLQSCGNSTVATTWHTYSIDGRNATADNFTDPVLMDVVKREIEEVQSIIQKYRPHLSKSWIGETAGAYGGGAPGLSNTYAGGFLWLDKLGVAAANGVDLVIRQSFYSGQYGLVTYKTLNPTPAYWLSYIYKQLVGQVVLSVNVTAAKITSGSTSSLPTIIRGYAHCTNKFNRLTSFDGSGSITLFILNLHKSDAVTLSFGGDLYGKTVEQFLLTPHDGTNITATEVDLNGKHLQLTSSDTVPAIEGQPLPRGKPVTLPSFTYGFFVINANASACR